jgi:hypothetical protein
MKILQFAERKRQGAAGWAQVKGRADAGEDVVEVIAIDEMRCQAVRGRLGAIGAAAEIAEHENAEGCIRLRFNRQKVGLGVNVKHHGSIS